MEQMFSTSAVSAHIRALQIANAQVRALHPGQTAERHDPPAAAREGLILPAAYQRERRKLAERRKAAFTVEPTGLNQVWQLDNSRVRDHHRRDLATRRLPGLLVQVRASPRSRPGPVISAGV